MQQHVCCIYKCAVYQIQFCIFCSCVLSAFNSIAILYLLVTKLYKLEDKIQRNRVTAGAIPKMVPVCEAGHISLPPEPAGSLLHTSATTVQQHRTGHHLIRHSWESQPCTVKRPLCIVPHPPTKQQQVTDEEW